MSRVRCQFVRVNGKRCDNPAEWLVGEPDNELNVCDDHLEKVAQDETAFERCAAAKMKRQMESLPLKQRQPRG